jgi:L-alanine-DL-glutamate epimerase-like enolase superfamily enzyme
MRALETARPQIESEQLDDPAKLWDRMLPILGHNRLGSRSMKRRTIYGESCAAPVWKLWGLETRPAADYTIGIDPIEKMVAKMKEFEGWPIYKIKLGTEDDLAIIRELRRHTDAIFRIDANTAWTGASTTPVASHGRLMPGSRYSRGPADGARWCPAATVA